MKISIITPCRDCEKTLVRTLESVLLQKTKHEIEYIVVDGKSTDSSLNILSRYANKYECIRYISEKDNSMTEALNKGMKMATGDIVASINADDIYLPGALDKIGDFFEDTGADIVMVNTFFITPEMKVKSKNTPRLFSPLLCALVECPFPECGIFFKRKCVTELGYFNEKIKYTQDFELYLRQYEKGYKFKYANIDASCFFYSNDNYSSTISDKMKEEVCSYFKYSSIFKKMNMSALSKVIKAILRLRQYYIFNKLNYDELIRRY